MVLPRARSSRSAVCGVETACVSGEDSIAQAARGSDAKRQSAGFVFCGIMCASRPGALGASFNGPVTLACGAGLPAGAQCVFNPSMPVTPGNSVIDVVMNISRGNEQRPLGSG
jgi:hypothetical protein